MIADTNINGTGNTFDIVCRDAEFCQNITGHEAIDIIFVASNFADLHIAASLSGNGNAID